MALYSNTLSVIRQYVGSAVGDLILSTAATPCDGTVYSDTMLRKGNDYYNEHGYKCYCYEGSAIEQEREVYDFVSSGSTVTFAPAFSPVIASGDKFELCHIFTEDEKRKAINLAIESLAGKYLVDIKDETTIPLEAGTYEYALPTSMLYLERVTTESATASGTFEWAAVVDPRDYRIIKAYPPKLKLHEDRYSVTAGKDLRLEGQGAQPLVDDDTDVIYLPPDWLVQKAITFLPQGKIQSNKLDATYRQALVLSTKEPRNWPPPRAQRIVE